MEHNSPTGTDRLATILSAIDRVNDCDPNKESVESGQAIAKERLYGQRMSHALLDFEPAASELLQIAARGQHIERWKSPRSAYPEGRVGYKRWRSELTLFHGQRVAELMLDAGYSNADCERVKFLIQKRNLRKDPETQTLEDVICLVFLKYYFASFAEKHSEAKLIDIVQKTWNKMSNKGHEAALTLRLDAHLAAIVSKALS